MEVDDGRKQRKELSERCSMFEIMSNNGKDQIEKLKQLVEDEEQKAA